jgi:hypothetical protein
MKTTQYILTLAMASLPWLPASAQTNPPVVPAATAPAARMSAGAAEILQLQQAGIGDAVIVSYINNAQTPFNLSVNDILTLKGAGLSGPTLSSMMAHDSALRQQTPGTSVAATVPPPTPPPMVAPPGGPVAASPGPVPTNGVPTDPAGANQTLVVQSTPPPPQVEVIPEAPGVEYAWTPGYWSWSGHGWIWIGGGWAHRPHPGVVWVGGHWAHHGHESIWIGGGWR